MEKQRIIIIGAGGHAKVVYDSLKLSLEKTGHGAVIGFVDDDNRLWGKALLGLPILGPIESLVGLDIHAVIIGIGENRARKRLYEWVKSRGYSLVNAIHPTAVIAGDVLIGEGVAIFATVVVNSGSVIGNNVILNTGCTVDHDCSIGDHVHIGPGAHLAGGVMVGEGAFLGTGASVIPYKKIGQWSIIGAGGVVLEDIPDGVTAVGLPAKVIKEQRER
jgi:sugar O-acyltransferase (sialic acid O-acetyltransferase NeuD family)